MSSRLVLVAMSVLCCARAQTRIPLAGYWERWIAGHLYDSVSVPSSYRPVGTARLVRSVELPPLSDGQRLILRFEGIANRGAVRVNAKEIGVLGPYTRHDFDATDQVKPGRNQIEVELADWQVPLGPTAAWESYGGIIYDAYAEIRTDPYIENARLGYTLAPDMKSVECRLDVFVRGTARREVQLAAELTRQGARVSQVRRTATVEAGNSSFSFNWKLDGVDLWSPQDPALYTLRVELSSPRGRDEFYTETGFRSLAIDGNRFLLNGRQAVLKGVARHHIWGDQGYTLTDAQIEQDLRMIKSMGATAVRLVHYPHDPRVVQTAARVGILVSEESGLSWVNFQKAPAATLETGLDNLERVVRRDWNNPALFAILLANESTPTLEVMKDARRRVKALKPDLFVSAARPGTSERSLESVRRLFDDAGFDFYTDHPYTYDSATFERVARVFNTKPLIFTEWGGPVGRLPRLLDEMIAAIGSLVEQGRLAGHCFWEWADMPEFSRVDVSMNDGILVEGVVTQERTVRHELFSQLSELFRYAPGEHKRSSRAPKLLPTRDLAADANSTYAPIPLESIAAGQKPDWEQFESAMAAYWKENGFTQRYWEQSGSRFWTWDEPELRIGPIPFRTPQVAGETRPLVVLNGKTVEIPVHDEADRLHFLGNTTVPDGYPTRGRAGELMGRYVVVYTDGERQEIPLRWGLEVARSNVIAVATRTNPVAVLSVPTIEYTKHPSREQYRTLLYTVSVKRRAIDRVVVSVDALPSDRPIVSLPNSTGSNYAAGGTALLVFGITAERRRSQ